MARAEPKPINLALQGGGAHGAFTWGVIDRLLEDGRLAFEGISGTSAGAMNAAVYADGVVKGGADGARQALADFWAAVARAGQASPIQRNPINLLFGDWSLDNSPSYLFFDLMSRLASPYEVNPLNLNPLRDLLEAQVDFARVESCWQTQLFVSATNVHTGRVRVFRNPEITADTVMASACLPFMFQAVEIDGVPYWDGGYMGNPALFPFFDCCTTSDVLLVQINPMERAETPKTAREILNRVNEITFNASLMKEFRAIEFVSRLIDQGRLDGTDYRQVRLHRIQDAEAIKSLSASSKLNAEWAFLTRLRDLGRDAAGQWLDTCFDRVGERSTVDISDML
ncbi:patatin [Rhodothalassium salexigens]|uniref:patatin-like phospholipase family protein n=1 Tax=Rhodothalassium salexigens TaxID=1086 RepID=UPI001913781C|nr:patatin-like phospholipase family protein [Rhodothalassium salexigens]MBK5912105.1 patatin [Rhodothalassium salexigens]MBK5919950.1 patatin [Rhodothalassium salexigens]